MVPGMVERELLAHNAHRNDWLSVTRSEAAERLSGSRSLSSALSTLCQLPRQAAHGLRVISSRIRLTPPQLRVQRPASLKTVDR